MTTNESGRNERIGAISKLPVFLDLSGRRAVLAGGSAGLAWKAELIAAAGADVIVLAPEPGAELLALAGSVRIEQRPWLDADFAGAAVAVGDFETVAEAAAFKAAADKAGVLCNTVDKAATCDFYFGAIVSRSPIMIGMTTDGTAPILGQAIRRKVEMVLPAWLAQWAELGRRIRPEVKARLAHGVQRRTFWEEFTEASFIAPPDAGAAERLLARAAALQQTPRKTPRPVLSIAIRGAGADWLTLGEIKALQGADVISEGGGVPAEVRAFFRRESRVVSAGAVPRAELARLAGEGALVVEVGPQEDS